VAEAGALASTPGESTVNGGMMPRRSSGLLVAAGSRRAPQPTAIGDLEWRQRAAVVGQVRAVRLAPMSGAPGVEVDLWDETGGVTLVFFGRRSVPGISAGTRLAAEGMVGNRGGRLAICNPLYRLLEHAAD
jgi:RecG-like helicase